MAATVAGSVMDASFTGAGFRRGFVAAQPLTPGTFLYGVVFGVLASEKGLAWVEALLMSVLVYSGSAQLAALQGWSASPLIAPLVTTVILVNARYVLYGASVQPWLRVASRPQAFATLFFLGDGNWALSMREYHAGYRDAGFLFGSGVATALPWFGMDDRRRRDRGRPGRRSARWTLTATSCSRSRPWRPRRTRAASPATC